MPPAFRGIGPAGGHRNDAARIEAGGPSTGYAAADLEKRR